MRNMVELNGYQLIMSSHDRGESDFIAHKFDAAGLPCSTVLLTAPSDKGGVSVPPEHNQAAARILRRDASPQAPTAPEHLPRGQRRSRAMEGHSFRPAESA